MSMITRSYHIKRNICVVQTFNFLRSSGQRAKSCSARDTVVKACREVGSLDARQTDAKTDALRDSDLDTLERMEKHRIVTK